MNLALTIVGGIVVMALGLALGPFWIPTVVLYFLGRKWLTVRGKKLVAQGTGFSSSFGLWLRCIWGWGWRSFLIFVLPFGLLACVLAGNDPRLAGQYLARVIVGWMLALFFVLDAPVWTIPKHRGAIMPGVSNSIYNQIAEEFQQGSYDQGLWLKSTTLAGGDQNKAAALYTAERALTLIAQQTPPPVPRSQFNYLAALAIAGLVAFWVLGVLSGFGQTSLVDLSHRYLPAQWASEIATLLPSSTQSPNAFPAQAAFDPTKLGAIPASAQSASATPLPPPPPGYVLDSGTNATPAVTPPANLSGDQAVPASSAESFFEKGHAKQIGGDFLGAASDYTIAIQINPSYPEPYFYRGGIYFQNGSFDSASDDYGTFIQLRPDDPQGYLNHGITEAKLSKLSEAIKDYNRAIELNPNYANAFLNRGVAETKMNLLDDAIKDFQAVIRLDQSNETAYFNLGACYAGQSKWNESVICYDYAIKLDPSDPEYYLNRGRSLFGRGDLANAKADYSRAIQVKSDYAVAYYARSIVEEQQGDADSAAADVAKARLYQAASSSLAGQPPQQAPSP